MKKNSRKKNRGIMLILMGLLLLAAALSLTLYNLYDGHRAGEISERVAAQLDGRLERQVDGQMSEKPEGEPAASSGEMEIPDYVLNPEMEMPAVPVDGNEYIGILSIPTLELELPIISEWTYPRLRIAPCRYSGTAYLDDLIIAGHNYSSHFGKLKTLREGDLVSFTDTDGNCFWYEVVELEMLQAADEEKMKRGDWDLTLFTCTVGGQNRVTVRCVRVEN